MRLGGWTRLGIVISVLYGALVGVIAYEGRPRLENMQSAWFSDAAEAIAKAISKRDGKEVSPYRVREAVLEKHASENVAWLEKVEASPSEQQRLFSSEVSQVNVRHRALIAKLPDRQREHWLLALVWWVGGTLFLFVTGWTVRWVFRGFRRDK